MGTFQPAFYYHPRPGMDRQWCATRNDLIRLLLHDARWRTTPDQNDDVITLLHEEGFSSEGEHLAAWNAAWHDLQYALAARDKLLKGTFAYCPLWARTRRIIPGPAVMVACRELDDDGWRRSVDEVFRVELPRDVRRLTASGDAVLAIDELFDDDIIVFKHRPTMRVFLTFKALSVYAERYKAFVKKGGVPSEPYILPQEPATAPPPLRVEAQEPTRQEQDLEKSSKSYEPRYYKDKELFKEHVQDVFFDYCDLEGEPPDKEYVAKHLKTPLSVKTMDRYLDYWHIPYPPYR